MKYYELSGGRPYWRGTKKELLYLCRDFLKLGVDFQVKQCNDGDGSIEPLGEYEKIKEHLTKKGE